MRIVGKDRLHGVRAGEALSRLGLDEAPANGGYYKLMTPAAAPQAMLDAGLGRRLWEASERLVRP